MGECFLYGNGGGGNTKKGYPLFTYTGQSEVINEDEKGRNWRIKFLTSGTLRISKLNGATDGIEVWMCGGGGGGGSSNTTGYSSGGGGGGHTAMGTINIEENTDYAIVVGAGGTSTSGNTTGKTGGTSSGFGLSAAGGSGGGYAGQPSGGAGGSGGGGHGSSAKGGTNGSNGSGTNGGTGDKINTHEFRDDNLPIYCGGGCGDEYTGAGDGSAGTSSSRDAPYNRGGGGAGRDGGKGGSGGSGIVAIRNRRVTNG